MSAYQGSCLCGAVTYTIQDKPRALAVCHCLPCRKTASASASNNFVVPQDKFKLTGETKTWKRKGDSGKDVTYTFCSVCPTILAVNAVAADGVVFVKPGTLDDEDLLRNTKPDMEIYTKNRYPWVTPCESAEQKESQ